MALTSAGAAVPIARRRRRVRRAPSDRPINWFAPLILVLGLFYLYPTISVLALSLTNASLASTDYGYTLDTFIDVVNGPDLWRTGFTTALFVAGSAGGQIVAGLLIALLLDAGSKRRLPGVQFVQLAVLTTWVVPGVSAGITWQLMFNEANSGFMNNVLAVIGLPPVAWLSSPDNALWSTVIANIWRGTALSMVLLHAGVQSISPTLYEAAAIDGAAGSQVIRFITLPQLKPILLITTVLATINALNSFEVVLALTGGGPGRATEILSLRAYNSVFQELNLAQGCVFAVLMLVIALVLTMIYSRLLGDSN